MGLIAEHPAWHQRGVQPAYSTAAATLHTSTSALYLVDNSPVALEATLRKRPSLVLFSADGYRIDFLHSGGGSGGSEGDVFQ